MKSEQAIEPGWTQRLTQAGMADLHVLLGGEMPPNHNAGDASPAWQRLSKPGLNGRERWRWLIQGDASTTRTVYVKRYRRTSWRAQWDRVLRQTAGHSAAWWEFQQSQRLALMDIPVPHAIGFAEMMLGPIERRSAVILEAVSGDAFDRQWLRMSADGDAWTRAPLRHEITRKLARFVAAFHRTGFRHRDLYLCHIFVEFGPARGAEPVFRLIDLARTFRPANWRRRRWTIKDLSQLDVSARQIGASRGDRTRFLRAYLDAAGGRAEARRLAADVARKSDGVLRKLGRSRGA